MKERNRNMEMLSSKQNMPYHKHTEALCLVKDEKRNCKNLQLSPVFREETDSSEHCALERSPRSRKDEDCTSRHGLEIKRFMADKKLYTCKHCKYITDRKNNLKRHVITMHESCTKTLECCEIVFPNKAALRDHVVSCHKHGYDCRLCGRNFCRKALLKRHVTVHSGQKDYICDVCGYATSHKSNLDRHKRRHGPKTFGGFHGMSMSDSMRLKSGTTTNFSIDSILYDIKPKSTRCNKSTTSFKSLDHGYDEKRQHISMITDDYPLPKQHGGNRKYWLKKRILSTYYDKEKSISSNTADSFHAEEKPMQTENECNVHQLMTPGGSLDQHRLDLDFHPFGKRLSPFLHHCKMCNILFENQMKLYYHMEDSHVFSLNAPLRPLTLEARQQII